MNNGFMNQDAVKYVEEVKSYVNGVLGTSLSMGYDLDAAREQENLTLLSKLLTDIELRNQIVDKIVEYGIKYSMPSYKVDLRADLREVVFMKNIYSFLNYTQIALLAKYFDKQITAEQSQKHSR